MRNTFSKPACLMLAALAAIVLVTTTGCGSKGPATYPVKGKVVFPDGSPMTGGVVEFESTTQEGGRRNARGAIQPDGTFTLTTLQKDDGAVAGPHRVLVREPRPDMMEDAEERTTLPKRMMDPSFERYETSALQFTVKEDENEFTIEVRRPGGRR